MILNLIPENLKQENYTTTRKNIKSKSQDWSSIITKNCKEQTSHFMIHLHEMKELNAHLEYLLEQSEKKLTQASETNAKFISIIAHDLKGPFCTIMISLALLKEKLDQNKIQDVEKYFNNTLNSAKRALNLLESLLKWTISQNREKSFNPVKIILFELIEEEIENFNTSAGQKQIILKHSIAHDLQISADLQMVKTILRNLIENAIKYTNTRGEVTINASESNQLVEITVKDNGVGISFAAQQELFKIDSFHSTTGTCNEKGPGLGLLFCKEFVEIHGGSIWVISEQGSGSEFKFTLPHYNP
jgi:two-component system, sensor histidine kinase and response regulator